MKRPDRSARIRKELAVAVVACQRGEPLPAELSPQATRYAATLLVGLLAGMWAEKSESAESPTAGGGRLNTGDYRRVAALTCAAVTGDSAGVREVAAEAAQKGRAEHLLTAAGLTVALATGATSDAGLAELRQMVARLAAEEETK